MAFLTQDKIKEIVEKRPEKFTPEQVLQKLVEQGHELEGFQPSQINKPRLTGIAEVGHDIGQIGAGIARSADTRIDKMQEIGQAQKEGKQGFFRSALQRLGQGAGFASDVIGEAVVGAGKALLPQRAEEVIGGVVESGVGAIANTAPVQSLMTRYQQLKETNPTLARDIDAALGFASLGLDIGTGGATGQIAKKGVQTGLTGAKKTAGLVGRGVGEIQGALTGTSQETIQQALESSFKGGVQADEFRKALRNQITPEEIVNNTRDAVDTISTRKSQRYAESLAPIADELVDTSGAVEGFSKKLSDFGVTITDGKLDFSKSKFRTVPEATRKIQQAFDEVVKLGDNATLRDVDVTRQALRELTFAGDDASARSANALINDAIDQVRSSGKQIDGYDTMLKQFAEDQEFLNEIQRSLSTGDKSTVDTAYRKLATSLKTNNERRMNLVRELDEATGGAILGTIAGQQLSEALPRGIFRQISSSLALGGVVTGGVSASWIPAILFASPRVTGEVVNALGIGARKAKIVTDAINKARKTLGIENVPIPPAAVIGEAIETSNEEGS